MSSTGGGYEEAVACDIEGDVAECRTRLTSFWASADHRSTVRTKYAVSMSLSKTKRQLSPATIVGHLLNGIKVVE